VADVVTSVGRPLLLARSVATIEELKDLLVYTTCNSLLGPLQCYDQQASILVDRYLCARKKDDKVEKMR
jgi:hypothetical protein